MRVHRSAHVRHFTVLPNGLLQDRRLSYTARGLLAGLLSRPDGRREDGRQMADTSPQGRGAVRRALKELTDAGYYRVETVRLPNGTLRSEAHVYDSPQLRRPLPGVPRPEPGESNSGRPDAPSVKKTGKAPTLPPPEEPVPDDQTRAAVATLFRVLRPEPRLRLGEAEALGLAPLVAQWLQRGCTADDLARALLPGLPAHLHSPAAVLHSRLTRKLPPVQEDRPHAAARYTECPGCHDPVPRPGLCRPCAGVAPRVPVADSHVALAGATRVRTALHAARTALRPHGGPAPAPAG
ncbi:hypothetical protein [Kitasatospora sp. NPDC091207]|uniref:hypothetical protein n=1 Tax=Kitasatospora sp. NPDC091207 TaxID=3364083 RepID=UPI0037F35528